MDQSISIPDTLVLRSLPVNIELLDLIQSYPDNNFGNLSSISAIEPTVQFHKASKQSELSAHERHKEMIRKKA